MRNRQADRQTAMLMRAGQWEGSILNHEIHGMGDKLNNLAEFMS